MALELFGNKNKMNSDDFVFDGLGGLSVKQDLFENAFVSSLYERILTDCFYKTAGLSEEKKSVFFDSCLTSEVRVGLIRRLAEAMRDKKILYLVYKNNVVREADSAEQNDIQNAIKTADFSKGICANFQEYSKTDILKLYAGFLYQALQTAKVGMLVSRSLQHKIADLRGTIAKNNAKEALIQAKAINEAMKQGKSVAKDAKDATEIAGFDISPTEKSFSFFCRLLALEIGLPQSYITGVLSDSLNSTGESDALAVERGLSLYYHSVFYPVVKELLKENISFKTDNWRKLGAIANLLPALEGSDLIDEKKKKEFIKEALK